VNFVTIVGTQPLFIKIAAVSRALCTRYREFLRTRAALRLSGQKPPLTASICPQPDVNLEVGSGSHKSYPPLYGDGAAAEKCVDLIGLKSEPMALAGKA
jgi:hypothetical protein